LAHCNVQASSGITKMYSTFPLQLLNKGEQFYQLGRMRRY